MRIGAIGCAVVAAWLAAGCEKAGPKASGKLTAAETALLAHLPDDATLVFGGNFLELQAQLARHAGVMSRGAPAGIEKWTACLAHHDQLRMFGTVNLRDGIVARMVATGMTLDDLAGCARDAGWTAALDPDRGYVAITAADRRNGFLRLADGAIYGYTMGPRGASGTRAELEAEVAAASRGNVTHSAKLVPIIERTDRSRAIWIAGTADGTSLAGKLGAISGWIDVRHGLAVSIDAEVQDDRLATRAVEGFGTLKTGSLLLGREVSAALDHVHLTRSGDHLKLSADLSAAQLEALFSKLAKMRH